MSRKLINWDINCAFIQGDFLLINNYNIFTIIYLNSLPLKFAKAGFANDDLNAAVENMYGNRIVSGLVANFIYL